MAVCCIEFVLYQRFSTKICLAINIGIYFLFLFIQRCNIRFPWRLKWTLNLLQKFKDSAITYRKYRKNKTVHVQVKKHNRKWTRQYKLGYRLNIQYTGNRQSQMNYNNFLMICIIYYRHKVVEFWSERSTGNRETLILKFEFWLSQKLRSSAKRTT